MYEYKCTVTRVVDGDTIDLIIDVGFKMTTTQRVRVLGIDTPELRSRDPEERLSAREAKDRVIEWCLGRTLGCRTEKSDAFGRYLAEIYDTQTSEDLTDYLISCGYEPYVRGK